MPNCLICGQLVDESDYCVVCKIKKIKRRSDLKRKYNVRWKDYLNMLKEQDYKCAICKTDIKEFNSAHIDHDHNTGEVRGLLCRDCNLGLGYFKDRVELLKDAIKYLE
jgi:DNA-directed RNA polymerase subunit RPC12/RpoP